MERTARVVGVDLQHQVAGLGDGAGRQDVDVAALRVLRVDHGAVPLAGADGQDLEVMAVEMLRAVVMDQSLGRG